MITLKFETISPLHISNQNELAHNLHYVVIDKQIYAIDIIKASKVLAAARIFNFSKDYSIDEVRAIINSRKEELAEKCSLYSIDATKDFLEHLESENKVGQTFILEFINSSGRFYIPASSVKGALLTALHKEFLGIKEQRQEKVIIKRADIRDKFVIHDSGFINEESLMIYRTGYGRPPINIMCVDSGVEFSLKIPKPGALSIAELKEKLKDYYPSQIKKTLESIRKHYSAKNLDAGANVFAELLNGIINYKLDENEYLINLGFGSGSWFKLYEDAIPPKFYNEKTKTVEEAHTTFVLLEEVDITQLGWCKLTIEEKI